jgi:hypothetical protein
MTAGPLDPMPLLVGVDATKLVGSFAFASGSWEKMADTSFVPAIADQATAMWGLGKGVGDTLDYQDASGNTFQVKIVGLLAGSVLQGKMIISEQAFLAKYPDAAGYRFFLIDAPREHDLRVGRLHLARDLRTVLVGQVGLAVGVRLVEGDRHRHETGHVHVEDLPVALVPTPKRQGVRVHLVDGQRLRDVALEVVVLGALVRTTARRAPQAERAERHKAQGEGCRHGPSPVLGSSL